LDIKSKSLNQKRTIIIVWSIWIVILIGLLLTYKAYDDDGQFYQDEKEKADEQAAYYSRMYRDTHDEGDYKNSVYWQGISNDCYRLAFDCLDKRDRVGVIIVLWVILAIPFIVYSRDRIRRLE